MSSNNGTAPTKPDIQVWPLRDGDPVHAENLRRFLQQEAEAFHTNVTVNSTDKLLEAVKRKRVQVLFVLAEKQTVGCTVQFPAAIPAWNPDSGKFDFIPALYSEDMSVIKKGVGTPFMKQRVEQSAGPGKKDGLDADGSKAGALVGEQAWHEDTAMGGLLKKFATTMPLSKGDTVLTLNLDTFGAAEGIKPAEDVDVIGLWRGNGKPGNLKVRDDVFAILWPTGGMPKIAATFTLGISSYNGYPVVRVHMAGNQNLAGEPGLESAVKGILEAGRKKVEKLEWLEDKSINPLQRTFIHALGETEISTALRNTGADSRILGDFFTYPLTMKYKEIPASMGVDIVDSSPLIPISDREYVPPGRQDPKQKPSKRTYAA